MAYDSDKRSAVAGTEQRDAHGHFAPRPPGESPDTSLESSHPVIDKLFPHGVSVDHKVNDDTLLDVHLGNPLRRITALLEEIKKQKAFSFDLKGSLGVAGIALVLGTFGIFGGTKALCSKGVQSHIGIFRVLQIEAPTDASILNRMRNIWDSAIGKKVTIPDSHRYVLVQQNESVIHLTGVLPKNSLSLSSLKIIATGDFDSCSQNLTVKDANGVEAY